MDPGPAPVPKKYEVYLNKVWEGSARIEVTAVSEKAAKEQALELAKHATFNQRYVSFSDVEVLEIK